jgi:hypothetical protein
MKSKTVQSEAPPAVAVQRVVSRPHPWKSAFAAQQKLKEARRIAGNLRDNKRNASNKEFSRMVWRTAQHRKAHPEEPNEQRKTANVES